MTETFVSFTFASREETRENMRTLWRRDINARARGKELLIPVPEHGLGFSMNELKGWLTPPLKTGMFDSERLPTGRCVRYWY